MGRNPVTVRGPYAKTELRRAEILRAARDAFAVNGYPAASLRGIAARAGLSQAGLSHHFGSKEELLAAVLAEREAEERRRAAQMVADGEGTDDVEGLERYLVELLRWHREESVELTGMWAELATAARQREHPAHQYFVDRYGRVRTELTGLFERWVSEGVLRPGLDPVHAATLLMAVLDGLQLQWLLDPGVEIVEPVHQFLQLIKRPQGRFRDR